MKIGDKVLIFQRDSNWNISRHMVGKIATVMNMGSSRNGEVGVDFGDAFNKSERVSDYLHRLDGSINTPTGYYLSTKCMYVIN